MCFSCVQSECDSVGVNATWKNVLEEYIAGLGDLWYNY